MEDSVRADYTKQLQTATSSEQRDNLREQLRNIHEGQFDFGRNYRVRELEDRYQIVYDDETGATDIHCVVSKETGDVARHCIKLVEEPFFQFNIHTKKSLTVYHKHTGTRVSSMSFIKDLPPEEARTQEDIRRA